MWLLARTARTASCENASSLSIDVGHDETDSDCQTDDEPNSSLPVGSVDEIMDDCLEFLIPLTSEEVVGSEMLHLWI